MDGNTWALTFRIGDLEPRDYLSFLLTCKSWYEIGQQCPAIKEAAKENARATHYTYTDYSRKKITKTSIMRAVVCHPATGYFRVVESYDYPKRSGHFSFQKIIIDNCDSPIVLIFQESTGRYADLNIYLDEEHMNYTESSHGTISLYWRDKDGETLEIVGWNHSKDEDKYQNLKDHIWDFPNRVLKVVGLAEGRLSWFNFVQANALPWQWTILFYPQLRDIDNLNSSDLYQW